MLNESRFSTGGAAFTLVAVPPCLVLPMTSPPLAPWRGRMQHLLARWNEPDVAAESLERWLLQFEPAERGIALRLAECVELHAWPRLVQECRLLHQRVCHELASAGFDLERFSDVDFSRVFTAKSGDLISFVYRKANRLPVTCFHNLEALDLEAAAGRALVILDDYIGSGSQFLLQAVARSPTNQALLRAYRHFCLAAVVVHDDARIKWRLLQRHGWEEVMAIEAQQLSCMDFSADCAQLTAALASVDWHQGGLVAVQRDFPLPAHPQLQPSERQQVRRFLRQQQPDGASTTDFLLGHHTFFYGAPNALPRVLLPLFKRLEDFTLDPRDRLRGLPADMLEYDINNRDPVTLFDRSS